MFDLDKWQEIWSTIQKNKLRTFLTSFGVFWGIFMLVLLLGAGKGLQNGVFREWGKSAINSIWVWDGKTSVPFNGLQPGRLIKFNNQDLESIVNEVPGIDLIAPRNRITGAFSITYKTKSAGYPAFGSNSDYFVLGGEELLKGRLLNKKDDIEKRKVIVLGERVRKILFGEKDGIGEYVNVNNIFFRVVGIFTTDIGGGQNEERAYIPFSTMQAVFNQPNQVQRIGLGVKKGFDVKEVKSGIKKLLASRHKFEETDEQAIGIRDLQEEYNRFQGLFNAISMFVWVVGMGTLMAGIVGVSNIMLIIVKERTKEIGIRKAIGATPWSIISLVIQESIVITSLSGYFGLLAGVGVLEGIRYAIENSETKAPYFDQPGVDISVALAAVAVLVVAGALAGLIPAIKAANIKPIEALRAD